MITEDLAGLVRSAIERAVADGILHLDVIPEVHLEHPRKREHGDWATNVALVVAKGQGAPRDIAGALKERLPDTELVAGVDVAGPGFLNFHLSPVWLHDVVRRAADEGSSFGLTAPGTREHVNVEYVSANPTGPVNVVSGRHAAAGDAIANLLEAAGYVVTREFYVNDAGRQMDIFGRSLAARYLEHFGVEASVPEDGYQGAYLKDVAADIAAEVGDRYVGVSEEERVAALKTAGLARMLEQIRSSLERFGTTYDVWFSERSLHDRGAIAAALTTLEERGLIKEEDGARWFRSTEFGDDKDRVVVRANGETTYLAADLAYLLDKFGRGSDRVIYLWGADHHGVIRRLRAGAEALGADPERVEVRLLQIVTLVAGDEALKASKRAGVIVPLDDLIEEVGKDAARYTFLGRSLDAPLEFDIALAKEQAPENPVYYVQYAHARICSILKRATEEGIAPDVGAAPLDRLGHPSEDELMRKLATFEEVVPEAAEMRAPQRITRFVEELASDFSAFYRDCRVVSEDAPLTQARLALCVATKAVLARGLGLLGVTAPTSM